LFVPSFLLSSPDKEQKDHTAFYEGVALKQALAYPKTINSKLRYDMSVTAN
jgi:hypothetical protein